MSRKDTVWGARHKIEEEEIKRIIEDYQTKLGIDINKLEASAIQALRSKDAAFWDKKRSKDAIKKLRGIND